MSHSLEERLRSNLNAFDGLLSLIPAKYYYDDKTQEQWKATKKSKTQAKLDKRRKFDLDEQSEESFSALGVKKKREKDAKPVVLPGENLKKRKGLCEAEQREDSKSESEKEDGGEVESEHEGVFFDDEGNEVTADTPIESDHEDEAEQPVKKTLNTKDHKSERTFKMEALSQKLREKLQVMKEKRKGPGSRVEGAPSSREAILVQRNRKKELRRRRLEEEKLNHNESFEDSDSESDSDLDEQLSHNTCKDTGEISSKDVIFQNIVFDDESRLTSDLQKFRKAPKIKGPFKNDIKAHLNLAEAKRANIESKDELQQIMTKQREEWKNTMLKIEGVKLKDDEKLLRKALKKKEAKKRKSAIEWKGRERTVANSIADKQKRREENLAIRRGNKGVKKSKQQKMKPKFKGIWGSKKRAGFEGRLESNKKYSC